MSNPRIVLDSESVEHYRNVMRPLLDRLREFFGWESDPVVTGRSRLGHFFDGIRDAVAAQQAWERFCATMPFAVSPTDICTEVARRLQDAS